jgi:tetratricopeptide (TPR) repeat protein
MAISSLEQAHRGTRNFAKAKEFTELGLQVVQGFPPNSINRLWWDGVFYAKRAQDFRHQREYERAVKDYQDALKFKEEYLERVAERLQQVEDRRAHAQISIVLTHAGLASLYLSMGKLDAALESYRRGLEGAKKWGLQFPNSGLHFGVGEILFRRKDVIGALSSFHKALDFGRKQQRPEAISHAARRIGDILRETGKETEAIAFYQQAIQEIESMRSLLASENTRQAYFGGWLGAYWGLTETLWQTGAHDRAFHYGERVQSRAFLDLLGTKVQLTRMKNAGELGRVELSDPEDSEEAYRLFVDKVRRTDPEQASLMTVEPLTLERVQALLEPQQALIEYLVTPQKTYLWILDKRQVRTFAISLSRKEIVAKVQALRTSITELKPLKQYQTIARDLYQQLVAPAKTFIQGKELIIIPHDVLHYLPFQALYSAEGRYLIEDYSISYLSSASLMQFTTAKRKALGEKVLAVGNPDRID